MKRYLKLLLISLCLVVIIAASSLAYGLIVHRFFTLRYVFDANFFIGAVIILAGIVIMFLPTDAFIKSNSVFERLTMIERKSDQREMRQQKARAVLWLGMFNILITGLIQLLLSVVI